MLYMWWTPAIRSRGVQGYQCIATRLVVGVEGLRRKEAQGQAAEDIVHHRVEAIPLQPIGGGVPDLTHDVCVRIPLFDGLAEGAPERDVVDLLWHIQPPAVDAKIDPVSCHVQEILADAFVLDVELGQGGDSPPGVVVGRVFGVMLIGTQRPAMHGEPIQIGRVAAAFQDMMEGPEAAAGMVEDPIQDDMHISGMGSLQQGAERGVAAQQGIHLHVVEGVIAMVGRCREDRVQIERIDTQRLEIVQLLDNAVQIAALEALLLGRGTPRLEGNARHWRPLLPTGEAIREDLIENGILYPVRGMKGHSVLCSLFAC